MTEAQIQLQNALTTTFLANLAFLSEYDKELYYRIDELSRMIENGTYKEKYALDFIMESGDFDIYDVVDLILTVHFKGIVGLIPLSSTVHTMVHNGSILIPKDKQFANYEEFINIYGNYMSSDLNKKLDEYNMNAASISDDVSIKLKERCTFNLSIKGIMILKSTQFIFLNLG